jgi:hypothetical protein
MIPTATPRSLLRRTMTARLSRHITGAVALSAIVLGVAACGSSSSTGTTTTTTAAGSTSTTSTTTSTSTSAPPTAASLAQIEAKLSAGQSASFVATYAVKATTSGTNQSINFTVGHAGSSTAFSIAEPQGSFEEIAVNNKDTWCVKSAGSWKCYTGSLGATFGASLNVFLDDFSESATLDRIRAERAGAYETSSSTGTVDGQAVTCITYHTHTDSGVYTVCITSQGVLAQVVGTNTQGHFTETLTSLSTSVPSNEFTPPATPTTIP